MKSVDLVADLRAKVQQAEKVERAWRQFRESCLAIIALSEQGMGAFDIEGPQEASRNGSGVSLDTFVLSQMNLGGEWSVKRMKSAVEKAISDGTFGLNETKNLGVSIYNSMNRIAKNEMATWHDKSGEKFLKLK